MTDDEATFLDAIRTHDPDAREVVAAITEALARDHNGSLMARLANLRRSSFDSECEWLGAVREVIGQ